MGKQPAPTRKYDRAASEDRLLQAARSIFSRHGFDGATTRMIADEAGVNLALITRYFENKQSLFLAVLEKAAIEADAAHLDFPPQDTLAAEGLAYADFQFRMQTENLEDVRILVGSIATDALFSHRFRSSILRMPNAEIRARIALHCRQLGTDRSADEIASTIERNAFAIVFYDMIMHGTQAESARQTLAKFVAAYCNNLANP